MASYFNYKIIECSIGTGEGFIDISQSISSMEYTESITSPVTYFSLAVINTGGILSKLKLRGGEIVRLVIEQDATKLRLTFDESDNIYYVYNIGNSTTESTKELFTLDLVPSEVFVNETSRLFKRYDNTLDNTVSKILKDELKTTRYNSSNIEKTINKYSFMSNARKPFTVLGWLCPKGIPQVERGNATNFVINFPRVT